MPRGLDPESTHEVIDCLRTIAHGDEHTLVLATHDIAIVKALCRRVLVLEGGPVLAEGGTRSLLAPNAESAYRVVVSSVSASLAPRLEAAFSGLALVFGFRLLLVAGAPLGHAAWGGRHRVLPTKLRAASAAAAVIIAVMAWVVLARAGIVPPGADPAAIRVATWVLAVFFTLNTVANGASKSAVERFAMTPATLFMVACLVVVATAQRP